MRLKASKLVGAPVYLDLPSVGATINIMLAASRAEESRSLRTPRKNLTC